MADVVTDTTQTAWCCAKGPQTPSCQFPKPAANCIWCFSCFMTREATATAWARAGKTSLHTGVSFLWSGEKNLSLWSLWIGTHGWDGLGRGWAGVPATGSTTEQETHGATTRSAPPATCRGVVLASLATLIWKPWIRGCKGTRHLTWVQQSLEEKKRVRCISNLAVKASFTSLSSLISAASPEWDARLEQTFQQQLYKRIMERTCGCGSLDPYHSPPGAAPCPLFRRTAPRSGSLAGAVRFGRTKSTSGSLEQAENCPVLFATYTAETEQLFTPHSFSTFDTLVHWQCKNSAD